MNTVFIIGNGFDINLEMKTKFCDFLEHYLTVKSHSVLIDNFKKDISNDIVNWSNLELTIGRYTAKLQTIKEFEEVYEDIKDRLADYLQNIESTFNYENKHRDKLLNYFAFPEKLLPPADEIAFDQYRNNWKTFQWNINIITLNYTMSLEKLIEYNGANIHINKNINGYPIMLQKIEHVHGFLDNRMIMGVNDDTQISNDSFKDILEVTEVLIKDNCNKAYKQLVEVSCQNRIKEAHLICIFGSSIGETDNMWWELIGEQLEKGCKLIIFYKGEDYPLRRDNLKWQDERKLKVAFLNKTKITEEQKKAVSSNIYITVNSKMFDIFPKNIVKEKELTTA